MGKLRIYNASAGSGKTYSLVREYLVLLFSSPRTDAYREILAVTFTNKAAWEMKERILACLEELSQGGQAKGMLSHIVSGAKLSEHQVRKKASDILESLYNDYSAFSVGTIDSFTTRLVRSFSHELRLPVGFDIVVDAEDILRQAVDMLMVRAGEDGKLSEMLVDFVLHNVDNGNNWDIASLLLSGAKIGQENASVEAFEKLSELKIEDYLELRRRITRYKQQVEKDLSALGEKACRIVYGTLGSDKILAGGANGVAGIFRKAAAGKILDINPDAPAIEKFFSGKYASSSATAQQKRAVETFGEELSCMLEDIADFVRKKKKAYAFADMVSAPLSKMAVAGQTGREVDDIKKRSSVMLLSEFNDIVSRHLRNEPVPFIYEKIGERYRHYFIDEFQDTSHLQWDNLRALVYNQLAQDGSALVVGDAKQAIYRWRGGDTKQFIDLYEHRAGLPAEQCQVDNLDTNYRSGGVIVDFTNAFFTETASLAGNEDFSRMYREGNRQKSQKAGQGFVSIRSIPGKTVKERLEPTLRAIVEEIRRVVDGDGYSYGDIYVVYRSNRDGSLIAEYLSENGIPTQSSESLLVVSSRAVCVLAAALRVLVFPDDLQARATLADFMEQRGAFAADPDREKYACITGRAGAFFDRLEAFSSGRFDRKEAEGLPLYEVLEYMAAAFSLWGCGQDAYIAAFLDMAADFVKNNTASCVAFLEHWNVKKAVAGIPGGEKNSAVTLMTIHKSKGLEAPVVIVPFANWKIKESEEVWVDIEQPDDPKNALYGLPVALVPLSGVKKTGLDQVYADYQSQIALDNLNMLYVALTRASEQLHVITSLDVSGSTVVEYFNRFFSSLEGEIFDDDDPDGVYTYSKGKRSGPQSVAPHRQGFEIPDMTGCPWRERLRVNLDWKKSWSVPRARAVERGNMIHRVLSDVADVHGVDAAVTRSLAAGWFSCEQAEDIRRSVRAVVEHPVLSPYFQSPWQGEPERELMTSQGKVLRPDRVCVDGMRAAVIDYKTGAPRAEHVLQVRLYAKVLSDMGYRVENALLAYLDGDTIDIVEC